MDAEEAHVATIEDVLDQVDGLRRDAADRVQAQFSSVGDLAAASTEQLTAIKGIGQVMADRIQTAARAGVPATVRKQASRAASTADRAVDRTTDQARRAVRTSIDSRSLVDRVLHTAMDGARTVVEHAPEPARRVIDRASGPARRLVDRAPEPARRIVDRVVKRED